MLWNLHYVLPKSIPLCLCFAVIGVTFAVFSKRERAKHPVELYMCYRQIHYIYYLCSSYIDRRCLWWSTCAQAQR